MSIKTKNKKYLIKTNKGIFNYDKIFSTIPLNEFYKYLEK